MVDITFRELVSLLKFEYGLSRKDFKKKTEISESAMVMLNRREEPITAHMLQKLKIVFGADVADPDSLARYRKHKYIAENLNTYKMHRSRKLQDVTQGVVAKELEVKEHVYAKIERGETTPDNWPLCQNIMRILGDDIYFIPSWEKNKHKKVPVIGFKKVNGVWDCKTVVKLCK